MTGNIQKKKLAARLKRKSRIRGQISGSANKPRVSVFKSNRFFYVQAIDDAKGTTLAAFDGAKAGVRSNKEGAAKAAQEFAKALKAQKIEEIVFDRNGYLYHGVVAAFADELRNNAIKF